MIIKKHFHILEAISVLLFSILANFIFDLKIDFGQQINWILISKLVILSISTFVFYFMVDKLKNTYSEAEKDYSNEKEPREKATNPVSKRYETKYLKIKNSVSLMIILSVVFSLLFFLIEPFVSLFK